jgi:hypothetical protein
MTGRALRLEDRGVKHSKLKTGAYALQQYGDADFHIKNDVLEKLRVPSGAGKLFRGERWWTWKSPFRCRSMVNRLLKRF